jgi:hypothetical protein
MSYNQNNPLSRKSSPLNEGGYCAKSAGKSGCVKKEGDSWRVISNKTGKLWDAHYSSKADAEAGLRAYHGGFSRKSSSPLNEQKWSGNRHDFKRRDVGGVMEKTGDVDHHYKAYEGFSRKSSSPLNQDERSGPTFLDKVKGTAQNIGSYISDVPGKLRQTNLPVFRPTSYDLPKLGNEGKFVASEREEEKARLAQSAKERQARVSEGSAFFRKSSPLNNTGITGLNYSDQLRYMPIEDDMHRGMSRQSSSPLNDNDEPRRGKITRGESETEYIRGNRPKKGGGKTSGRSVTITETDEGASKTVRTTGGKVKTKKISKERAAKIKKRKEKTHKTELK